MTRKQTPEGALQTLVMDWLAAEHILAFRMQTGVLRNPAGRPVSFGVPGMADILAFPKILLPDITKWGNANLTYYSQTDTVWIELKSPAG